jgi:hypothetical protein
MHNSWLNVSSDTHTSFFVAEYHKMRPLLMRDKTNRRSVNVLLVYKGQLVVALKQKHLVRRTSVYCCEGFYFRYLREDNNFVKIKSRANTLNYNVDFLT